MASRGELLDAIFGRRTATRLPLARRALRELAAARESLARLEAELVVSARLDGATWEEIAADLRVSRRAVRARHPGS